MSSTGKGRVARVIGPVVDIEFPADSMPSIFNALHVETTMSGTTRTLTLEVAQHIGDNLVRAISMQPTDGMVRGAEVTDTGAAISVPVGDVTKGHVFNTLGESLDVPTSSLDIKERWPIHPMFQHHHLILKSVGQSTAMHQHSINLSQRLKCSRPVSKLSIY